MDQIKNQSFVSTCIVDKGSRFSVWQQHGKAIADTGLLVLLALLILSVVTVLMQIL